MGFSIGHVIGGTVIVYILLRSFLLAFGKKKHELQSVIIAACITLAFATVAGGFGFADGGQPVFLLAFTAYIIPTLLAIRIELFRLSRIKKKESANNQDEVA
jgi:hypothetical protein